MSSWKKAAKNNQKVHRERHQPEGRKHLGLLEKKKDYKLRAQHNHEQEKTLKLLHRRALNKNPDEFYHHMIRSKVQDDEHHELEQPDEHTKEQIALMQSQDVKYISMKRTVETNKIKRLQADLHLIDHASNVKNSHIFFVDNEEDAKNFDVAKRLDTHPSLLDRRTNRMRLNDLEKLGVPDLDNESIKKAVSTRNDMYKELQRRIDREKELTIVQQKMEIKRILQQKRLLKPKRLKKATKNSAAVYKFQYERKK